jgi:hypothetical protein
MCMRLSVLEAMLRSKSSLRRGSGHFVRCVSHLVACGCRTCGGGHDHDACGGGGEVELARRGKRIS